MEHCSAPARAGGPAATASRAQAAKIAAEIFPLEQAAKTTLFAAGNEADVRKKRRRRLFAND
jgi:hypothetical protein